MEKVLNQAELLAEAILESEEYINMRLTEQAVMKDEEATLLVANYSEKRSKVEELLANPNMDRGELAKAGQELQEAEHMLDHNKLIAKMQETNDAFTDMMKQVNKIIKKVVTGEDEEEVTEEEIMMMAEAGSEKGSIDSEENELIKNIFEFKEQTVGEVCTHRKDTDLLFLSESDEEWAARIASTRHTYYPICGKGIDDIAGVLSTKDYFRLDDKSRENVMKKAVSAAVFVTENTPANTLFYTMKISREYFAVVVDEYGGMSGIVTMHDLLELLVGDLTEKDEKKNMKFPA